MTDICSSCSTPRGRPDDKFCFICGASFQQEAPQKKRVEENKNEEYLESLKFCTDCGVSVDFEVKIRPKFCPDCGNSYITSLPPPTAARCTCPTCSFVHSTGPDGVKYCHVCGTSANRFIDENGPQPTPPKPTKPGRIIQEPRERANGVAPAESQKELKQPEILVKVPDKAPVVTKIQTVDAKAPPELTRVKSSAPTTEGLLSFGQCMTHDVPSVITQANIGMKVVQEMKELAVKYKKLEEAHARSLEKLLGEENKKVTRILEQDGMCLFGGVWVEFVGHLYGRVDIIRELSTRVVEEVVSPLKTLESTAAMSLKELNNKVKDAQNEMAKIVETMNKSKDDCLKSIQTAREALAREKVDRSELTTTAKMGHYVASLTHSSFVKAKGKALGQANTYITQIKETNEAQIKFVNETLRGHLDQFQTLELQRLKQVAIRLKALVDVCKSQDEKMVQQDISTYSLLETLDPEKDIQTYIQTWLIDYGMPPDVVPYVYEIPLSPADIDALDESPDSEGAKKRETVYNSTINSLMEKQKSSHPQLDVPVVMHVLCEACQNLGDGVKTEGIFRLSPETSLLRSTEAKFNQGDFTLSGPAADPIIASSLLKSWLRSLNEPVIPAALYDDAIRCIETMKIEIASKRSIAARQTLSQKGVSIAPAAKGQDVHAAVLAVYNRLPVLHRNIVKRLSNLTKLIVVQPKSRMNYESLAVCFAPCLFRSPDSADPFQALKWSRSEKDFTYYLLSALDEASSAAAASSVSLSVSASVAAGVTSFAPPAASPSPRNPIPPATPSPSQRMLLDPSQRAVLEKKIPRAAPPPTRAKLPDNNSQTPAN